LNASDLMLRLELGAFLDDYISVIDNNQLELWPGFFVDDCLYEIMSKENEESSMPAPLIRCEGIAMIRDRVVSLRNANIYEFPIYRHFVSGLSFERIDADSVSLTASYLVINTSPAGFSSVYQAGRYYDRLVRVGASWRIKSKRAVYETLKVQTLLAFPI